MHSGKETQGFSGVEMEPWEDQGTLQKEMSTELSDTQA